MTAVLVQVASLFAVAVPAAAHGGVYVGPGSTIGPGGSTGGGPSSTSAGAPVTDSAAWDVWWSLNRDQFLGLKAAIHGGDPVTGSDGFFLGRETPSDAARREALQPDETVLRAVVVPALRDAMEGTDDVDLITGCLLALAKIGERGVEDPADELIGLFRGFLDHPNQEVHETAAIALGVLASHSAASVLAELLADDGPARALVGERSVSARTRAFAAYGLGLIGSRAENEAVRRFAVHHLVRVLGTKDLPEEIAVASDIALGLLPLELEDVESDGPEPQAPTHSRRGQIAFLLDRYEARATRDAERAQLPVAIARLCQGVEGALRARAIEVFARPLGLHARAPEAVVQGAIQGLSLLGDGDEDESDVRLRAVLRTSAERGDRSARHHALLALGRVAGRAGGGRAGEARSQVRVFLLGRLSRGSGAERPWAALGLALLEREALARRERAPEAVVSALRHVLATEGGPQDAGAYCLALALLEDRESIPAIEAHVQDGDENLRGYAATALGLMRATGSVPLLRTVIVEKTRYRPGLLREASIALALLGDRSIVPHLLERLRAATTMIESVATASALGHVGDRRAVDALVAIVRDAKVNETTRAFAAVALGQICDKEPLPWNAKFAADASWLGAPPTFFDPLLGKGVLDLL